MRLFSLLVLLPILANAITITYPVANTTVDIAKAWNVTWIHSDSDPAYLIISLAKVGVVPSSQAVRVLATNVSTSADQFNVSANNEAIFSNMMSGQNVTLSGDFLKGWGLMINSETISVNGSGSTTNPLLAESGPFDLATNGTGSSSSSGSSTSSSTSSSSGIAMSTGAGKGNAVAAVMGAAALVALL